MTSEKVAALWDRSAPHLAPAVALCGGTHTLDDVRDMVMSGRVRLWVGDRSALVTEIVEFPRLKSLHLWLCGGDMDELLNDIRPAAEAWGREQGCSRCTTAGRLGWKRVMAPLGYEARWESCVKEIA